MGILIEDGKGSGKIAEVNEFNQLSVVAESVPAEGYQAEKGNAFIIHAECHTAASASGGFIHITNNEVDNPIHITRIYIDPHTITPTNLICTQLFEAVAVGGTDVSSTAIVQKNKGSANIYDLTVLASDSGADLTYTGGEQYHAFPIKTMTGIQRNMNETNIIPAGKSVMFGWKTVDGSNAVDGEIVSFSINVVKRLS